MRTAMIVCMLVIGLASTAAGARAQEIDKVLSRVNDNVVTTSDVWRARTLKLVAQQGFGVSAAPATTDAAAQRALENRHLVLAEVARMAIPAPAADQLAARRTAWRARFSGGEDVDALLAKTGITSTELDDWLRDDVRIDTYLAQQFTQPDAGIRTAAINTWMSGLRARAGLPR